MYTCDCFLFLWQVKQRNGLSTTIKMESFLIFVLGSLSTKMHSNINPRHRGNKKRSIESMRVGSSLGFLACYAILTMLF